MSSARCKHLEKSRVCVNRVLCIAQQNHAGAVYLGSIQVSGSHVFPHRRVHFFQKIACGGRRTGRRGVQGDTFSKRVLINRSQGGLLSGAIFSKNPVWEVLLKLTNVSCGPTRPAPILYHRVFLIIPRSLNHLCVEVLAIVSIDQPHTTRGDGFGTLWRSIRDIL